MFPCSQLHFPFVPLFPKSIFFDFGVSCSLNTAFFPRVSSFIFLLFPCSQLHFPCVPLFPKSIFFDFGVPCSLNTVFVPVLQLHFPFVPLFTASFSFCSLVPNNFKAMFPGSLIPLGDPHIFPKIRAFKIQVLKIVGSIIPAILPQDPQCYFQFHFLHSDLDWIEITRYFLLSFKAPSALSPGKSSVENHFPVNLLQA